jgi:hypothetical protein
LIIKQDIFPVLGILLIIDDDIVPCAMAGGTEPEAIEDCLPAFPELRSILSLKTTENTSVMKLPAASHGVSLHMLFVTQTRQAAGYLP